jgi:uroporphyrinogen decarboxylase
MQEYRDVRKHHTLVEICKQPELASEVTITAAEKLGVDAAIIFADLLLPLEPMGLPFEFQAGEGPVVHHPVRTAEDVLALRTDRAGDLDYVARAIQKVAAHFRDRLGIIGFCGAPYTLASYMIEQLHSHQADDVPRSAGVAQPAGQDCEGSRGILPAAGTGGGRCDPDFR